MKDRDRTRGDPESIRTGSRVRIRRSMVPGLPKIDEQGTVIRSDARGVLVRLDSGTDALCEPAVLTLIVP